MDHHHEEEEAMESCRVPPGFRFHPTEEELVGYYLARKVAAAPPSHSQLNNLHIIQEVDLYRIEPWDLQEVCKQQQQQELTAPEWYFFSYKDRKYPSGTRTNRATAAGFWKATGRDKPVVSSSGGRAVIIGMRKTLVFYKGRAPHGCRTHWIMHEYRLQSSHHHAPAQEEGWVVCRAFQKPIPNQRPFFPTAGYYDLYSTTTARLHVDDGDRSNFLPRLGLGLGSAAAAAPPPPPPLPAGSSSSSFPHLSYSADDDDDDLESKKQHLLSLSGIVLPPLEKESPTAIASCCSPSDGGYAYAAAAHYDDEHDELMMIRPPQGGGGREEAAASAAAAGAIDWSFLDSLLSATSQLHEPSGSSLLHY